MKTTNPDENKVHTLPDFLAESIGKGIRKARKEKSYSTGDLAQKLNMSEEAVNEIERGETPLTITKADEIAGALGKTMEELVRHGEGFYFNGDVSNSGVNSSIDSSYANNYNTGVLEKTLNNLTAALNRICDMLEKKL